MLSHPAATQTLVREVFADVHMLTHLSSPTESGACIGPGKIALLEAIEASGSISGAGRLLKMSYKRAWDLIEDLNNNFAEPMVITATGGSHGGGAQLTSNGKILIKHYREIEQTAHAAVRSRLHLVGKMTLGTN